MEHFHRMHFKTCIKYLKITNEIKTEFIDDSKRFISAVDYYFLGEDNQKFKVIFDVFSSLFIINFCFETPKRQLSLTTHIFMWGRKTKRKETFWHI